MQLGLEGKCALVTGSSRGIGEVLPRLWRARASASWSPDATRSGWSASRRKSPPSGAQPGWWAPSIPTRAQPHVAAAAIRAFGGVDILVNNAAGYGQNGWDNLTAEAWLARLNTNLVSMVRIIRLLAPPMKERRWGRLIQMASSGPAFSGSSYADYAAAKAGVLSLTVAASREYGRFGVTSNSIGCGTIRTPHIEEVMLSRAAAAYRGTMDEAEIYLSTSGTLPHFASNGTMQNACGRFGRVQDVADMVCFLASERAGYVTGANIRVDGGQMPTYNP